MVISLPTSRPGMCRDLTANRLAANVDAKHLIDEMLSADSRMRFLIKLLQSFPIPAPQLH
jgi:hypothetical protein